MGACSLQASCACVCFLFIAGTASLAANAFDLISCEWRHTTRGVFVTLVCTLKRHGVLWRADKAAARVEASVHRCRIADRLVIITTAKACVCFQYAVAWLMCTKALFWGDREMKRLSSVHLPSHRWTRGGWGGLIAAPRPRWPHTHG